MFDFINQQEPPKAPVKPKKKKTSAVAVRPNLRKVLQKYRKSILQVPERKYLIGPARIYYLDIEEFVIAYYIPTDRSFIDINDRLKMDAGTFIHNEIQRYLWDIGLLEGGFEDGKYIEPSFENVEAGWRGRCDGIMDLGKFMSYQTSKHYESERVLLEIKTCPKDKFARIMCVQDIPEYNLWQAEIYMKEWDLDKCVFIFVNMDSFVQKTFVYEYDGQYFDRAKAKTEEAFSFVHKRELPRYQILTQEEWKNVLALFDKQMSP